MNDSDFELYRAGQRQLPNTNLTSSHYYDEALKQYLQGPDRTI